MMFRKGKYNMTYISDYRTSILEIPYVDNELSMIILLPEKIEDNSTGLEKVSLSFMKQDLNPGPSENFSDNNCKLSFLISKLGFLQL